MEYIKGMEARIIILSLIVGLIFSCTSVRDSYFNNREKVTKKLAAADTASDQDSLYADYSTRQKDFNRFEDTTVIELQTPGKAPSKSFEEQFETAVKQFDNEMYEQSCSKFRQFSNTLNKDDSLYFESKFYMSECLIMNNEIKAAEALLSNLINEQQTPGEVLQKSIVRLGQVYCVTDRKPEAEKLFNRLAREYPNSIYLRVANCNSFK